MDDLEWDRSHDWVIYRRHHQYTRISAIINEHDLTKQLIAVRRISDQYKNVAPAQLKNAVVNGKLLIGVFNAVKTRRIKEQAASLKLKLELQDASRIADLPFDKTTGMVWLIEDNAESERLAQQMIATGVPVVEHNPTDTSPLK